MASASTRRPQAALTWRYGGQTYSDPLTAQDLLTLARAVDHEGAPRAGVLWALVQRYAWLRSGGAGSNLRGAYPSLHSLVQAYAQPINPRWFPTGDLHKERVRKLEAADRHQAADWERQRAQRRPVYARQGWDELKPATVDVMNRWVAGRLSNPVPGAIHYWAGSQRDSREAHQEARPSLPVVYYKGRAENVFFGAKNTYKTPRSWVKPDNAHHLLGSEPPMMLAGFGGSGMWPWLMGAAALWWFLRTKN